MNTPYFLIDKEMLLKNIKEFQDALAQIWPNSQLAYSVKTNSLPWILSYMKECNIYSEVVSDEEYELSKLCGYNDSEIVFNGPIKGSKTFETALNGSAIINFDSQNDLRCYAQNTIENDSNIGLRININPELFAENDIGYEKEGFRFGFSDETGDLFDAIQNIKAKNTTIKFGLHLHCNSVTRALTVYETIARYCAKIIRKYDLEISYIDIGGGFFGGVEGKPTAKEYITVIKDVLCPVVNINETKLIIEPGSALIGSAVDLVTSVIDVKDTAKARIVTTDGSRIHIDPLWKKTRYMYSSNSTCQNIVDKQIICGYTCMDHDRLMCIENERELRPGDQVIYHRVGAYSMTFGGAFIRYFPEVYVKDGEERYLIRKRMSVEEYFNMHSI